MANPFRRRGRGGGSFLERNTRLIGVIAIAAIVGGSAFALLLSGGVFARQYTITAYFADAAGIHRGDKVTVAGLDAGTVKSLTIEHGQVAMDLGVSKDVELSSDSRADVVVETLLGKRSVNLVDGDSPKALEDGDVIPVDRTTTPVDITQLNDISVRLMNQSDAKSLNDLLDEVSGITRGKEGQVRQIITGLTKVAAAVDARKDQLSHLIVSLRILATTLGERGQRIVSLIDNLDPVLSNLAARQRQIQTLLVSTSSASQETADLVKRNRSVLDTTLDSLHTDLMTLNQHQVDIAAAISYLEQGVQGYSSVGYSQGTCGQQDDPGRCDPGVPNRWANIFVQSLGPAGIDAFLGQCGAVDQLIDQTLGTSCEDSSPPGLPLGLGGQNNGGGGGSGGGGGNGGGVVPIPTPSLPVPPPGGGLPQNVGDLIGSTIQAPSLGGSLP